MAYNVNEFNCDIVLMCIRVLFCFQVGICLLASLDRTVLSRYGVASCALVEHREVDSCISCIMMQN
jgi:hypothetical protein